MFERISRLINIIFPEQDLSYRSGVSFDDISYFFQRESAFVAFDDESFI